MKKRAFLILLLLFAVSVARGADAFTFASLPDEVRPGKEERFLFTCEAGGTGDIYLTDEDGTVIPIKENLSFQKGSTRVMWDGLDEENAPLTRGEYTLYVRLDGALYSAPLSIGDVSPIATILTAQDTVLYGDDWAATISLNMGGRLIIEMEINDLWETMLTKSASFEGDIALALPLQYGEKPLPCGEYRIRVTLKDLSGVRGASEMFVLTIYDSEDELTSKAVLAEASEEAAPISGAEPAEAAIEPEKQQTVSHIVIPSGETTKEQETSYWTMTLGDLTDEQAIWDIMMQPITVLSYSDKIATETYKLRKTPDKNASRDNVVGEISYQSQGVHVLETLESGWSRVEVYNTSYGPQNTSRRGYGDTAALITGYVETNALKVIQPLSEYGLLIDKLTQKLYIFKDAKIIGTRLVSTGQPTKAQPWNETPAGEFLLNSRTGGFWSGNMFCDLAIRVNGGCLLHEVPSIVNSETGSHDFSVTVPLLGQKASHGCIRVQRAENEQGQNMKWIWNNVKVGTKVLVWEDSTQYHEYPSADLKLYYNPNGGKYYHSTARCSSVNKRYLPLTEFTYGELETEVFALLTPCKTCTPPARPEVIRAENQARGFDE